MPSWEVAKRLMLTERSVTRDDHGRLDLTGHQATFTGVLSAQSGSGDGSWDVRTLACHGTFQVNHRP